MSIFTKNKKNKPDYTFSGTPFLKKFKPREKYVFHSDYFVIDNYYATIMSFFHSHGSHDSYGAFWGINRIPSGLKAGVTTINFEQVRRMGESWISEHQSIAENVANMNENSQSQGGTNTSKERAKAASTDLQVIAQELNQGASYLNVHDRILVKAPTLDALDDAVAKIERLYLDRFATQWAAPYTGEQRQELAHVFSGNAHKRGRGFYFTSMEFAGSYNLVTHGIEDPRGEYVGYMTGDVNNSAVLFDVNNYEHHIVIGSEQYNDYSDFNDDVSNGRAHVSDMWGSKIGQAALLDNGRIVHIIMDNADLDKLGPTMNGITNRIDLNNGEVNMFEMFGKTEDELSIYSAQMEKLKLMTEQIYPSTDADRSIIRNSLEKILTQFYVDQRMWVENAKNHRDKLRVVGIAHTEVPTLEIFAAYLESYYKSQVNKSSRDDEELHAANVLNGTFHAMLTSAADLFNVHTSDSIDGVVNGKRCVYDFSGLMQRGRGIAMAQLVNIIGYAVSTLGRGDTVIIHGAEYIDKGIRKYINDQFEHLFNRGGRVAYLYNSIDKVMDDQDFNHFDKADYTIFGTMSDNAVERYEKCLGANISPDLCRLITTKSSNTCYIRRGFDNVIFQQNLQLLPPKDDGNKKKHGRRGEVA